MANPSIQRSPDLNAYARRLAREPAFDRLTRNEQRLAMRAAINYLITAITERRDIEEAYRFAVSQVTAWKGGK